MVPKVAQKLESIVQSVMGLGFDSLWELSSWKHRDDDTELTPTAESSDNCKACELPEGNIITVGTDISIA